MTQQPEDAQATPLSPATRTRVPLPSEIPVMQYMERFTSTLNRFAKGLTPAWARDFPQFRFPNKPDEHYQLIRTEKLEALLNEMDATEATRKRVREDMQFLDRELLRLFKGRDYEAKFHQNRYRRFQIIYIALAMLASIIASLQAMFQSRDLQTATILAGIAGFIALTASAVAILGERLPSFTFWMQERRSAEHLRREYYRYLLNLPPYTTLNLKQRKLLLSSRAAQISGGSYNRPEEEHVGGGAG